MTVAELGDRISSRELTEWAAYERVAGPLGPERSDVHAAMVAAMIANVNRGKGKKPVSVEDCLPKWDQPAKKRDDGGDMRAMFRELTAKQEPKVVRPLLGPDGNPITT